MKTKKQRKIEALEEQLSMVLFEMLEMVYFFDEDGSDEQKAAEKELWQKKADKRDALKAKIKKLGGVA